MRNNPVDRLDPKNVLEPGEIERILDSRWADRRVKNETEIFSYGKEPVRQYIDFSRMEDGNLAADHIFLIESEIDQGTWRGYQWTETEEPEDVFDGDYRVFGTIFDAPVHTSPERLPYELSNTIEALSSKDAMTFTSGEDQLFEDYERYIEKVDW